MTIERFPRLQRPVLKGAAAALLVLLLGVAVSAWTFSQTAALPFSKVPDNASQRGVVRYAMDGETAEVSFQANQGLRYVRRCTPPDVAGECVAVQLQARFAAQLKQPEVLDVELRARRWSSEVLVVQLSRGAEPFLVLPVARPA